MNRIAAQAGVPRLHAHLLRHTAATQYLVAGGDAISLQNKLGHTTLAMTSHYVHLASQHLARINQRVSPMDNVKIKPLNRPYRKAQR
jgi:site-specific recombinase XerD